MAGVDSTRLVPCNSCRAPISPNSQMCIKCKEKYPLAACRLCLKPVLSHDLIIGHRSTDDDRPFVYPPELRSPGVHRECLLKTLPKLSGVEKLVCGDCGALQITLDDKDLTVARESGYIALPNVCASCGNPNPCSQIATRWPPSLLSDRQCWRCHLYLFEKLERITTVTPGERLNPRFYHEVCWERADKDRAEVEKVAAEKRKRTMGQRRRDGACVMCGRPLGLLDKMWFREKHARCDEFQAS